MRLLVCGGRHYDDRATVYFTLDAIHKATPVSVVIHGSAPGADTLADSWAQERLIPCQRFPAAWTMLGRAAGPIRNARMLTEGKPDAVLAFPGNDGTADMVRKARSAGVPVTVVAPAD